MTLNEFKHWLDGFSESITGAPTYEQWTKIKAKIDSLYMELNTGINKRSYDSVTIPAPYISEPIWLAPMPRDISAPFPQVNCSND